MDRDPDTSDDAGRPKDMHGTDEQPPVPVRKTLDFSENTPSWRHRRSRSETKFIKVTEGWKVTSKPRSQSANAVTQMTLKYQQHTDNPTCKNWINANIQETWTSANGGEVRTSPTEGGNRRNNATLTQQTGPHPQRAHNRHFRRRHNMEPEPNQVINLSSITLTKVQIYILSRGTKFCPTPRSYNELMFQEDIGEGNRRLRLREFFYEENAPAQLPARPKFYKKSMWRPPEGRDRALDAFCWTVESMTANHRPAPVRNKNLNKEQKQALSELRELVAERKIRISPADKGGAVVVQDVEAYEQEAFRQLNNPVHYRSLDNNPTTDIALLSNELVERLFSQNLIDEACRKWAVVDPEQVRTHQFYHLPKVHKDRTQPPGRPIVSGVGGPTEKISKLLDHFLQPIVQNLPSYIQDTTHFLRIVEEWNERYSPLPPHAQLVTIDVVGLYSNIPHDEVALSLRESLANNRHLVSSCPRPILSWRWSSTC